LVEMKKFSLLVIAACCSLLASAQKVYFLYLQTEDQAPFYVRVGDKIYSSAASGFLILPNLIDTTHYLNIGFAKSNEPETKFSVAINQNDRGFLIKKFDDGLALFDFEDLSLLKSAAAQKDNTVYETKSDAFSNVLSKAANDPSIVRVAVGKKEEPKTEPEKKEEAATQAEQKETVVTSDELQQKEKLPADSAGAAPSETAKEITPTSDSAVTTKQNNVDSLTRQPDIPDTTTFQQTNTEKKEEIAGHEIAYKPSVVTRHSESSTTEGFGVVYFDKSDESIDTIRVLIPAVKTKLETETTPSVDVQAKENVDSLAETAKAEIDSKAKETQPAGSIENKSLCKNTATDKDFLKLRKRMAAGDTDEEMIDEAKKDFKNKCYSVEQIRYLSTLFLTSAAKYQFFDAAYEHVSDKNNFPSLGAEIKDDYYARRFKALVGE
jgi:hypothetical protein